MGDSAKNHQQNEFYKALPNQWYTYKDILEIANYLQKRVSMKPKIGMICGTGLGSMSKSLKIVASFKYEDIPKFPVSTVQSHAGNLIFGELHETPILCMQGRIHFYEGYPLCTCTMPIRLMKLLGITHLIVSNAAGGLNPNFKIGDIMLIKDHINLMGFAGNNPLSGPNDPRFGPRFFPMVNVYNSDILKNVKKIATSSDTLKNIIREGVFTCLGGPNFETVAELRALKTLGVDAVGMSTVHEVIAAKHCGITCFAFSLITNLCSTNYEDENQLECDDVLAVGAQREEHLIKLVDIVIQFLAENKLK